MKNSKKLLICLAAVLLLVTSCGKVAKLENGQEAVVTIKDGKDISVDDLYNKMKEQYALSVLLDMIDTQLLEKLYPTNNDETSSIDSQVAEFKYYYEAYYSTQYSSFNEFLYKFYGVKTEEELKEIFSLTYKREKATKEYAKSLVKDEEIEKYYEENVIGDIQASHILIKADYKNGDDKETIEKAKEDAKKKAEDLIDKLNDADEDEVAELFAELAKEHSEDGSSEEGGDLGWFNKGDMVEAFESATIKLKVDEYTKKPVETEYGYHIILKTGEKEKESLEDAKDEIIKKLVEKLIKEDSNIQYKALISLRKEHGIEIQDTELKKQYKAHVDQYSE